MAATAEKAPNKEVGEILAEYNGYRRRTVGRDMLSSGVKIAAVGLFGAAAVATAAIAIPVELTVGKAIVAGAALYGAGKLIEGGIKRIMGGKSKK